MSQRNAPNDIILIQDPGRRKNYAVPLGELAAAKVTPGTWASVTASTVTFVIPAPGITDVTPPFIRMPSSVPSVLIQDPTNQSSYFLEYSDLLKFETDRKFQYGEYMISFIMPTGLEFIEELPLRLRELLQSGERGMGSGAARQGSQPDQKK